MKIIIIEGIDNTGKDTLIAGIKNHFTNNIVYHCEKPNTNELTEQEIEFAKLLGYCCYLYNSDTYDAYILNRSWYGEYVYGTLYRRHDCADVFAMISNIENTLEKVIDKDDICYITLLADPEFVAKNDDGLSLSENKLDSIKDEIALFKEIHSESNIKNKHIVYVNNGDSFRNKEDILNEIIGYIENE